MNYTLLPRFYSFRETETRCELDKAHRVRMQHGFAANRSARTETRNPKALPQNRKL